MSNFNNLFPHCILHNFLSIVEYSKEHFVSHFALGGFSSQFCVFKTRGFKLRYWILFTFLLDWLRFQELSVRSGF